MTILYKSLVCFLGTILSIYLITDFTGIEFGQVAVILGYLGVIAFPILLIREIIKEFK